MARNRSLVFIAISVIIVIGVVVIASIAALEANHSNEIKLIGTCNSTLYIWIDALSSSVTSITTFSNHTTTVYASTIPVLLPTETVTSSYETTLITNTSIQFTTTNTTTEGSYPGVEWSVETCTFAP